MHCCSKLSASVWPARGTGKAKTAERAPLARKVNPSDVSGTGLGLTVRVSSVVSGGLVAMTSGPGAESPPEQAISAVNASASAGASISVDGSADGSADVGFSATNILVGDGVGCLVGGRAAILVVGGVGILTVGRVDCLSVGGVAILAGGRVGCLSGSDVGILVGKTDWLKYIVRDL